MTPAERGYWVYAAYQHLRGFATSAINLDEYEVTIQVGEALTLLNSLRNRSVVVIAELLRLGKAQGLGKQKILTQILPAVEKLRSPRVLVRRDAARNIQAVEEHLVVPGQLYEVGGLLWEALEPTLVERASIYILQHTCVMPRPKTDELSLLSKEGLRDADAESALGITTSFRIVHTFDGPGLSEPVLFNEYVWRKDHAKLAHAVSAFESSEKALIEDALSTTAACQGLPTEHLTLAPILFQNIRAFGIIDVVQVCTNDGATKEFAFTPHLTTHPATTQLADDLLNDVRAVLACIGYGENFSRISRLGGAAREKTVNFLEKLLREGRAGDATAIGVDYQLLEQRGIITVEPTATPPGGRYAMVLLRSDPLDVALKVIQDSTRVTLPRPAFVHTRNLDPGSLFVGPEQTRATAAPDLAKQPEPVKEARNHFLRKIRREVF